MRIFSVIAILIQIAWVKSQTSPTNEEIADCEADTTKMHCYGQCVDYNANCLFCEGKLTNNVCTKPTATATSCVQPGFCLDDAGTNCIDCRSEQKCLNNCNGYWDLKLNTCIKTLHKTFKLSSSGTLCSSLSQSDCSKCRAQMYEWSTTLSKCVKCPSINWNSTTMKCSLLSNQISSNSGLAYRTDGNYGICYNDPTNTYLDLFSNSCEKCPDNCTSCGAYTNCVSCQTNFQYTDVPGICACKGDYYIDISAPTVCQSCASKVQNCVKCKSDGTCLKCQNNFGLDKTLGYCIYCAQLNSTNSLYCDIPALLFCKTKSDDGAYCYECNSSDLVFDTQLKYCVCKDGKNLDLATGLCSKCSDTLTNCATCNNGTCLTCLDPNEVLNQTKTGCVCQGYVKNSQCFQCNATLSNCLACSTDGKICTQCMTTYGLQDSDQTCYQCSSLDVNCNSCDGSKLCQSCTNGFTLNKSTNKCVCDTSTNLRAFVNGLCIVCSTNISQCSKCSASSDGLTAICTECSGMYVTVNGKCQLCGEGYYKDGNTCQSCKVAYCKSCTSTDCYTCKSGFSLSGNTCSCLAPNYLDTDSSCKPCSIKYGPLCNSCTATACLTCGGTDYTPSADGCNCVNGVSLSSVCHKCPLNCSACSLSTDLTTTQNCTSCLSDYKVMYDQTCGKCSLTQYYNSADKKCYACNSNCTGCADNSAGGSCSGCSNGFTLNSAGNCECGSSKVLIGQSCQNCSDVYNANCTSCDSSKCLTCVTNYYLDPSNICITCPIGKYYLASTKACSNCGLHCSKCENITGNCTLCGDNYELNADKMCECSKSKTLNSSQQCVLCSSLLNNCSECSSPTVCTTCDTNYKVLSDKCGQCGEGQYYTSSTKKCQQCGLNCKTCSDENGYCTGSCFNNYRLDSNSCVCNKDRILQQSLCLNCSQIYPNCVECDSTQCTDCAAPFVKTSNGCQPCGSDEIYNSTSKTCNKCKNLIRNCNSCSSASVCTLCVSNTFTTSSDGSSCICPSGNYFVAGSVNDSTDQCIPCNSFDSNCLQCNAANKCSLCSDTYAFDSQLGKCRQCTSNEYLDNRPDDNVQACVNCKTIHPKCSSCTNSTTCTQCSDNYDLNSSTCQCSDTKILVPNPTNSNQQICKLCSEVVDPFCQQCSSTTTCTICLPNYIWNQGFKRCVPQISVNILNSKDGSKNALADSYNLSVVIPNIFASAALKITIYFFDTIEQYNTSVQALQAAKIPDEAIPFSFKDCVVFAQDNLKTLPHPKYTKQVQEDGTNILKRVDTFSLHEGIVRFVVSIESQNGSFIRFSSNIDIQNDRFYSNIKDLSFAMGKKQQIVSQFQNYQTFYQIMLHKNGICTKDSQCSGNGVCSIQESMCICNPDFNLFDCSDYLTFSYDSILQSISKSLLVTNPSTYQDIFVSKQLPLLQTATSTSSHAGITANLNAIDQIVTNEIIDNSQLEELQNLMENVMNSVSANIKSISQDITPAQLIATIKRLEYITEDLLVNFDNVVGYTTPEMQLLAKISRDPTRLIYGVNTKNVFDVNYDNVGALFEPTTYESVGLQIKMLRYSFKNNPHRLTNANFTDQGHSFPLIIYHVYKQSQTIKRNLESSASLNFSPINITFTFDLPNPGSYKNLVCLSLEVSDSDVESDKYVLCNSMSILNSQVVCQCQNSATLFEDFNYHYLPKPEEGDGNDDKAPLSMVIAIVVLSILLSLLLIIQVRGRTKNRMTVKMDDDYARRKAVEITRRRQQQEQEAHQLNTEIRDVKSTIQDTQMNTLGLCKSDDYRCQDSIFQQSPVLKPKNNSKFVLSTKSNQQNQDFIIGNSEKDVNDKKEQYDDEVQSGGSMFSSMQRQIDPNLLSSGMQQRFDDDQVENKVQRESASKFEN